MHVFFAKCLHIVYTTLQTTPKNGKADTMPKLTKKFISNIIPPLTSQIFFRDSTLLGLGLRVTPGSCGYIVEGRVNGVLHRVTLGKESQLTPSAARKKAKRLLADMAGGNDPSIERAKRKVRGVTLQEVLDHYLGVRNLKPNSVRAYRHMLSRCLGDWMDSPITSITREMVEKRHVDLRKPTKQGTSGEAQANTVMHMLGTLINFAAANYEIDGKPIILVNPVKRLTNNRRWYPHRRRQSIIPDPQTFGMVQRSNGIETPEGQRTI